MEVPRKPKRVPRKQLFVYQIDQLLKLTEAQLKVWLYHYRREGGGDGRLSFALQTTVRGATGLSRSAISHARTWLVRNGWLRVVGLLSEKYGNASLREYRCAFPQESESRGIGSGKPKGTHSETYGVGTGKPKAQASESLEEVKGPLEVTAMPIPEEVFRATSSHGSKQANQQARAEATPPPVAAEQEEPFTAWINSLGDGELAKTSAIAGNRTEDERFGPWLQPFLLVNAIHPINTIENLRKELIAAWEVYSILPDTFDPLNLLVWNRVHKRGNLYLRSCVQYRAALNSPEDHLLNDYATHDFDHCKLCKEHKLLSWGQRLAVKRQEEEAKAWQEAETRRVAKLAKFDFSTPTAQAVEVFKQLLGEGWTPGCVKANFDSGVWQHQHAYAATAHFLKEQEKVSWNDFCTLVNYIKELETETPKNVSPTPPSSNFQTDEL